MSSVTVFAPATVANVAVGFDILGFAVEGLGDQVRVTRTKALGVSFDAISGTADSSAIPTDPKLNTAGLPVMLMCEDFKPNFGISIQIIKGIPLGSGMGGSAASAVGAVVATNQLFFQEGVIPRLIDFKQLIEYALAGEAVASGSKHADNIAPCLYGGLTLSYPGERPNVVSVPYPSTLWCVLVHPQIRIDTKTARGVLSPNLLLKTHIEQSARLAFFILACTTQNMDLLKQNCEDLVIEPQRAHLIPGFDEVKRAALQAGAFACSISGAGPAVFAFADDEEIAKGASQKMIEAFQHVGLAARSWVSPLRSRGAQVT